MTAEYERVMRRSTRRRIRLEVQRRRTERLLVSTISVARTPVEQNGGGAGDVGRSGNH